MNFLGRDAVTRDNAKKIRKLGDECQTIHGKVNSVYAALINMTNMGPMAVDMEEKVLNALPKGIDIKNNKKFRWM